MFKPPLGGFPIAPQTPFGLHIGYLGIHYPFVPPLDTPAMILSRKARNSTISGTLTATTAAIIAGISCRPKPLSRIAWIPLDTRKYYDSLVISLGQT